MPLRGPHWCTAVERTALAAVIDSSGRLRRVGDDRKRMAIHMRTPSDVTGAGDSVTVITHVRGDEPPRSPLVAYRR